MAGAPPSRLFTTEEVLGLMDSDTDEPMRPGSDDDLGLDLGGSASDSDTEDQGYVSNKCSNTITCTLYS